MRALLSGTLLLGLALAPSSGAFAREAAEKAAGCRSFSGSAKQLLTGATPIGIGPCDGVQPGGYHESKVGGCTFNFLFKGSDGRKYMGTAGHCLVPHGKEKVWRPGKGLVTKGMVKGDLQRVGESAYGVLDNLRDFGLIRLDKGVPASASMCHFGGPDSGATDPSAGTLLHHYGNGLVYGETIPARTSVTADVLGGEWYVYAAGAALFGDSGSAVITEDGHAVGALVHLSPFGVGISRLAPHLERAEKALGIRLTLQMAPLEQ
jgi:hypothetical protein